MKHNLNFCERAEKSSPVSLFSYSQCKFVCLLPALHLLLRVVQAPFGLELGLCQISCINHNGKFFGENGRYNVLYLNGNFYQISGNFVYKLKCKQPTSFVFWKLFE